MRWPKYWSFSFSISPSNGHPGLISFRMDWYLTKKGVCITVGNTAMCTKADLPDEDRISDISLMIFDSYGMLEKCIYLHGGQQSWNVNLLKGVTYSIYACIMPRTLKSESKMKRTPEVVTGFSHV